MALDISTKTGWALGAGDSLAPIYGLWVLPRKAGQPPGDLQIGYRMSCLASQVEDAIAVHRPDRIVIEAPLHMADHTSRLLISLAGAVDMVCEEHSVRCEEAHVNQVRSLVLGRVATGTGKARVMAFCAQQGWTPIDDNVGDALVLLRYCHIMERTRRLI